MSGHPDDPVPPQGWRCAINTSRVDTSRAGIDGDCSMRDKIHRDTNLDHPTRSEGGQ